MISPSYKNVEEGKAMVLLCTGSTLDKFDINLLPEKDLIQVGVNSIIYNEEYSLDYYFCAHNVANEGPNHPHAELELKDPQLGRIQNLPEGTDIFCGDPRDFHDGFTSPQITSFSGSTFRCSPDAAFRTDVPEASRVALYNHSIAFPALQVLLYTGVKKIYLVGCDCGGQSSYLSDEKVPWADDTLDMIRRWETFKVFAHSSYPDVEIISINPVALKGVFDEDIFHG